MYGRINLEGGGRQHWRDATAGHARWLSGSIRREVSLAEMMMMMPNEMINLERGGHQRWGESGDSWTRKSAHWQVLELV
jgi:hypothetical protein